MSRRNPINFALSVIDDTNSTKTCDIFINFIIFEQF